MTRHQAVEEHRKMWTWITEQLERMTEEESKRIDIFLLKKSYINDHRKEIAKKYGVNIIEKNKGCYCFLCCYACYVELQLIANEEECTCNFCPVKVAKDDKNKKGLKCLGGLYAQTENSNPLEKRIKAARAISELPENESIKDIDIIL